MRFSTTNTMDFGVNIIHLHVFCDVLLYALIHDTCLLFFTELMTLACRHYISMMICHFFHTKNVSEIKNTW